MAPLLKTEIFIKIHAMCVILSFFLTPFSRTNLRANYIYGFFLICWRYSDHFKVNRLVFVQTFLFSYSKMCPSQHNAMCPSKQDAMCPFEHDAMCPFKHEAGIKLELL